MIIINSNTRQFNIPGAELVFGVTADSETERKQFQCPRFVGNGLDLASCFIRINYRNANGKTDFYLVDDMVIDGDNITFSWLLSPKVTEYRGQIKFVMCAVGPDLKLKWHTTQGTGQVMEGLEPDNSHVESQTADVVAQLISMVEAQTTAVEKVGADQVVAVKATAKTAQDSAVTAIETAGKNTLDSIPADYTALSAAVRKTAPGIVCSAEGEVITLSDASDNCLMGLRIFGKSTQDGTPTPENPVEIVSVGKPVVRICEKNLFPGHVTNYQNADGSTVNVNADGSITVHKVAGADLLFRKNMYFPAGTYVISNGLDVGHPIYIQVFGEALDSTPSKVIQWPGGTTDVFLFARETTEADATLFPQIEVGSVATAYEPYKPTQTIATTNTFHGIPVASGGNYTDENGQQWICDEVDFERGVYVKRCEECVIDGSGYITVGQHSNGQHYCTQEAQGIIELDGSAPKMVLSDRYMASPWSNKNNTAYCIGRSIILTDNRFIDKETTVSVLGAEKPKCIYVLAKPIETPLSETELAAYRALHTNKPNTTILNDSGAYMSVDYTADTKLYIDNKIKEALL